MADARRMGANTPCRYRFGAGVCVAAGVRFGAGVRFVETGPQPGGVQDEGAADFDKSPQGQRTLQRMSLASRRQCVPGTLPPGSTTYTDEQSQRNFDRVSRLVVPGDPLKSALLVNPLATEAGGSHWHGGGKHWQSQDHPEWQTLAAWVRGN